MQQQATATSQRPACNPQQRQPDIQQCPRLQRTWRHQRLTARNCRQRQRQIYRRALASYRLGDRLTMNVQPAYLGHLSPRQRLQLVANTQRARPQCPRRYGAKAAQRKYPVDRQPQQTLWTATRCKHLRLRERSVNGQAQLKQSLAGLSRARYDLSRL